MTNYSACLLFIGVTLRDGIGAEAKRAGNWQETIKFANEMIASTMRKLKMENGLNSVVATTDLISQPQKENESADNVVDNQGTFP